MILSALLLSRLITNTTLPTSSVGLTGPTEPTGPNYYQLFDARLVAPGSGSDNSLGTLIVTSPFVLTKYYIYQENGVSGQLHIMVNTSTSSHAFDPVPPFTDFSGLLTTP